MKILNLDAVNLVPAFRSLGHVVISAGYQKSCDICIDRPYNAPAVYDHVCSVGFVPDFVFLCDSGNMPYFHHIEELPCVSAFYSIDTWCNHWHLPFANAFDIVFSAQKGYAEALAESGVPVLWLPLFAPSSVIPRVEVPRDVPVSFVGTIGHRNNPDRQSFLKQFKELHPLVTYSGPYAELYARSRVVLNQSACSEVNFRCFEAMACGAALLTERGCMGMEDLFVEGETILPGYIRNDRRGAAEAAARALADPAVLARVARAGQALVLERHLDRHRAAAIVAAATSCLEENRPAKRLAELPRRKCLISTAYVMVGTDIVDSALEKHARYFLDLAAQYYAARDVAPAA
ncbi:MAG: glycosyltransferase [Desulfovibrio sp.]|nr:glycosyltransferase [Desulfovibrio sp.]